MNDERHALVIDVVKALINRIEARSIWTKSHSDRVAHYAVQVVKTMGMDDDNKVRDLQFAGLLHDIGYIGTADFLLTKQTLTDKEFGIIREHPAEGAKILEGIEQLREIAPIIRHHHERIDGKGYPDRLEGDKIPFFARILHVTDSFDSMTSDRSYRRSPGIEYALSELRKYSGLQFDPQVVEAFLKIATLEESLML